MRSFKLNSPELKPIFIEPHPNQLAKLLDKTKPTGRTAKIDRLTFPYLHRTSYSEVVDIINEDKDIDRYYFVSPKDPRKFHNEKINVIVGEPGDGKSVLLQKLARYHKNDETKLTLFISAEK